MTLQLSGPHRTTYNALFQHPVPHNLHWPDVRSLLDALAESVEENQGKLKIKRNGQMLVLQRPRGKDVADMRELTQIRHFLERSESPVPKPVADGIHLLIVIDHREARVYRSELHGSVPQRIVPYDPHGFGRNLHYVQDDSNGQRKPERKSFYEAVARTMEAAEKVLIFGSGTGASSAMDQLVAELKEHHHELARRIVATVVVDERHLAENQLLAMARKFYSTTPPGKVDELTAGKGNR